jgi:MFS family permease
MRTFLLIWFGQIVSLTGSRLTSFALGVWVFQTTGSTTSLGLVYVATIVPNVLISIPAGALADRWERRLVMLVSDTGAALSTVAIVVLLFTGNLEIWHIYLLTALNSAFSAFQMPAYSAAITMLVPKQLLGRVSGLMQLGRAGPRVIGPVTAGLLLNVIGLEGIILIDFGTFLLALFTLLMVRIPMPEGTQELRRPGTSIWKQAGHALTYLVERPGLLGVLIYFVVFNLFIGVVQVLLTPLVLSMGSVEALGSVLSIAGLGMLIGSLLMSAWGGPERRVIGLLGSSALSGLALAAFGLQPSLALIASAGFVVFFMIPIFDGANQALTQSKVSPEIQGRVFALQQAASYSTLPIGYLAAGPLADRVFEPLLAPGGPLAGSVGQVIGVGPGRGIGLMFVLVGLSVTLAAIVSFLHPRVRRVDIELADVLPDAQTLAKSPVAREGQPEKSSGALAVET